MAALKGGNMEDETAALRAELAQTNRQILDERDEEMRHGIQRTRLEARRAEIVTRMLELTAPAASAAAPPYRVVTGPRASVAPTAMPMLQPTVAPARPLTTAAVPANQLTGRRKHKPEGLPTLANMVLAALKNGETDGMRSCEIANAIRKTWWPGVKTPDVGAAVWRLAGAGRLEKSGNRYRLNGYVNGAANGAAA
jgi:hypothetical protein